LVTRRATGTPEAVARALRAGEPPAPFLLAAGPSDYWRDEIARAYRDGAAAAGAELVRLEGDELDAAGLAAALESLSLFALERRIWIREGAKLEKACEDRLLAWADAPPAPGGSLAILLTTAREPSELKFLGSLAAKAVVVACEERPADAAREADRLAREAGLTLPPGLAAALGARATSLLSLRQEIEKLRLAAGPDGRLQASSTAALMAGRTGASVDRWAAAAIARDAASTRAEAAALAAEGVSAGNALWAVASVALGALEPQGYGYGYRGRSGSTPSLRPGAARAALDAVYQTDRAMKRGEIRDEEVLDVLERGLRESLGTTGGTTRGTAAGGTSVRNA
jgi:DNA polymerase III delta subunit